MASTSHSSVGSPGTSPISMNLPPDSSAPVGNNARHLFPDPAKTVHPEFAFPDANIEIETEDQLFWVHEYHLTRFSVFASLIQEARGSASSPNSRLNLVCKEKSVDFYNTFRLVYAALIFGAPSFDSDTLISALRIASTYEHQTLRSFSVSRLEQMSLSAIQRIELADEFQLSDWEPAAFAELCDRTKAITPTEAISLGIQRFARLAEAWEDRHRQQRRRILQVVDKLARAHASLGQEQRTYVNEVLQGVEFSDGMLRLEPRWQNELQPTREEAAAQTICASYRRYRFRRLMKQRRAARIILAHYLRYQRRSATQTEVEKRIRGLYTKYRQCLESDPHYTPPIITSHQRKMIILGCMPHVMIYVNCLLTASERQTNLRRERSAAAPSFLASLNFAATSSITQRLKNLVTAFEPGSDVLTQIQSLQSMAKSVDELRRRVIEHCGRNAIPADMEVHYSLGVSPVNNVLLGGARCTA